MFKSRKKQEDYDRDEVENSQRLADIGAAIDLEGAPESTPVPPSAPVATDVE